MDLKEQLNELSVKLEGKSKEQAVELIKQFEEKHNEFVNDQVKAVKDEFTSQIEELKQHANELDVKLQAKAKQEKASGDAIKSLIEENFDNIKEVRVGKSIEIKAVGDMTLGTNLTGDQPRDYSSDVVNTPGQLLNVADLVGSVQIEGGTYTYPVESGSEGSIGSATEGSAKSQIDYDYTMVDLNTNYIAGFSVYSKKMRNNLPFLQSNLPIVLRRDYAIAENSAFNTVLEGSATASTEVITGKNKVQMLINDIANLEGANHYANGIVVRPADFYDILTTEVSTGAGYGLPGICTFEGGQLRINGIPVYRANWVSANKYYVGDWSRVKKVVTEGLSLEFSESDSDNFRKNNITARIEAQVGLAVEQPSALIFGDFTAV